MVNENNNILNVVLIFILGFFFSKLISNNCNCMNKYIDIIPNSSNGIIQGFSVGSPRCGYNVQTEPSEP